MNANKQDVGGLLPCPFCGDNNLGHKADCYLALCLLPDIPPPAVMEAAWNRRAELCRAAPAGSGEVHRAMNEIETVAWLALRKTPEQLGEEARKELAAREPDWLDTGRLCMGTGKPEWPHNCICPKHAQPHPTDFPHVQRFDWTQDGMEQVRPECYGPNEYVQWDEYAALLRKLQQGADYVMVPREALRVEARRLRYRATETCGLSPQTTDAGAQMVHTAEALEQFASQGQEGGHASVD